MVDLDPTDNPLLWPTYEPRRSVAARRFDGVLFSHGRLYRDGYLVRDLLTGATTAVDAAMFEAIYAPIAT